MEEMVKIHPYQEVPAADLNAMQEFVQRSLDAALADLIFDEGRFSYMAVAKTGPMEVQVGQGRYFVAGRSYRKAATTTHSLVSLVPSTNTRIVLVTVAGQQVDGAPATRKFLIDATARLTQPREVSTRILREAVIDLVAGAPGPSPSRPAVPAGSIVVASLVLGPAGIVGDIAMEEANRAFRLEQVVADVVALRDQDARFASQVANLGTQILTLRTLIDEKASSRAVGVTINEILALKERVGLPDLFALAGFDDFANDDETDAAFAGANADVDGGSVQFGAAETQGKLIEPLNPADANLHLAPDGLTLPKTSGLQTVIANLSHAGEIAIASYAASTTELKQQTLSRIYHWYTQMQSYPSTLALLRSKTSVKVFDPKTSATITLNLAGKKWELVDFGNDGTTAKSGYRKIKVSETYWDLDEVTVAVTGARIAQTLLVPESGWYAQVNVGFTQVAATGDVHVALCRLTAAGTPDQSQVLARTTVPAAQLKTWKRSGADTLTPVAFTPTFLKAGERIGIVIATPGNHRVGHSLGSAVTQGTAMVSPDGGAYWQGEIDKDLCLTLARLQFWWTKTTVTLKDVTLAGGIRKILAAWTGAEPAGTSLVIEAQIAGVWRTIGEDDATILAAGPTQVPLRLAFIGTTAIQPAFDRTASRIVVSRPATPTVHVSTPRTLPAATTATKVTVDLVLMGFDPAIHTVAVAILHGAGHATAAAAALAETAALQGGEIRRRFVASGLPAVADYRIRITMTTTDAGRTFGVTSRRDIAE